MPVIVPAQLQDAFCARAREANKYTVGTVAVAYRILPFELPQPASYEDLSRRFMSDVNGVRMPQTTRTYADHGGLAIIVR